MREKNGVVLNIIGVYFLFSFIIGLVLKNDIIETLLLDGLFNNSSVSSLYWFVLLTNGLITFLLLYSGIRRYIFYKREMQEYKSKKQKEKRKNVKKKKNKK